MLLGDGGINWPQTFLWLRMEVSRKWSEEVHLVNLEYFWGDG